MIFKQIIFFEMNNTPIYNGSNCFYMINQLKGNLLKNKRLKPYLIIFFSFNVNKNKLGYK